MDPLTLIIMGAETVQAFDNYAEQKKAADKEREIGELYMEQARAEARAKLQQAEQERLERMAEETAERTEDRRAIARLEAMYAKRGVMFSGSAIDVTAEQARVQELNQAAKNRVSLYEQDIRGWQAEGALIKGRNIQGVYDAKADTMDAAAKMALAINLGPGSQGSPGALAYKEFAPEIGLPTSNDLTKSFYGLENNLSNLPILGGIADSLASSAGHLFGADFNGREQQVAEANQQINNQIVQGEAMLIEQQKVNKKKQSDINDWSLY